MLHKQQQLFNYVYYITKKRGNQALGHACVFLILDKVVC